MSKRNILIISILISAVLSTLFLLYYVNKTYINNVHSEILNRPLSEREISCQTKLNLISKTVSKLNEDLKKTRICSKENINMIDTIVQKSKEIMVQCKDYNQTENIGKNIVLFENFKREYCLVKP